MKHQDRVTDFFVQIKCCCGQCNPISHTPKPKLRTKKNQVVVSKNYLFSPWKLGKIPILTNIFQMGWFNHQPKNHVLGRSAESQNDLLFYNVLWFEMPQEEGTAGLWKIYWFGEFFSDLRNPKTPQKKLFYLGFFLPLASFPTLFAAVIFFFN